MTKEEYIDKAIEYLHSNAQSKLDQGLINFETYETISVNLDIIEDYLTETLPDSFDEEELKVMDLRIDEI